MSPEEYLTSNKHRSSIADKPNQEQNSSYFCISNGFMGKRQYPAILTMLCFCWVREKLSARLKMAWYGMIQHQSSLKDCSTSNRSFLSNYPACTLVCFHILVITRWGLKLPSAPLCALKSNTKLSHCPQLTCWAQGQFLFAATETESNTNRMNDCFLAPHVYRESAEVVQQQEYLSSVLGNRIHPQASRYKKKKKQKNITSVKRHWWWRSCTNSKNIKILMSVVFFLGVLQMH